MYMYMHNEKTLYMYYKPQLMMHLHKITPISFPYFYERNGLAEKKLKSNMLNFFKIFLPNNI